MKSEILGLVVLVAMVGCHQGGGVASAPERAPTLTAKIHDAQGRFVGEASVTARGADSVEVTIDATDTMPAGPHGIHLHSVGKCEALTFASAGPHLNPHGKKHGLNNPAGPHAGDMLNFDGTHAVLVAAATFAELTDADGTSIVIHAGADDQVTDPSGNSGARIACGVFEGRGY